CTHRLLTHHFLSPLVTCIATQRVHFGTYPHAVLGSCVCCWGVHCLVHATVVQRCTGMFTVCVCVASLVFGPAPFRRCDGRERRGCWRVGSKSSRQTSGRQHPPPTSSSLAVCFASEGVRAP
ncbi:unnamed protein product, partial [Ixodes persulcatus]